MVSVRNIKKFVEDHPELGDLGKEILSKLKDLGEREVLMGEQAKKLIGVPRIAEQFFLEIQCSPEHIQMGLGDITAAAHQKK